MSNKDKREMTNYIQDTFIALCQAQNVITVPAENWADKVVAVESAIMELLNTEDFIGKIAVVAKNKQDQKRLSSKLKHYSEVLLSNVVNDIEALKRDDIYAMVLVDSESFNDYTKYLLVLKAEELSARMIMITS